MQVQRKRKLLTPWTYSNFSLNLLIVYLVYFEGHILFVRFKSKFNHVSQST